MSLRRFKIYHTKTTNGVKTPCKEKAKLKKK